MHGTNVSRHYGTKPNNYIPVEIIEKEKQRKRIEACKKWWIEINKQLKRGRARVYVPSACIAESFKVLAELAFSPDRKCFKSPQQYYYWRKKLSKDLSFPPSKLRQFTRKIKYHDVPMDRDIIISVDRFYEVFAKSQKNVGVIDLSVAATAKYLMDYYDVPKENLHIITLDAALLGGIQKSQDLPNAYDPTLEKHSVERIFE